MRDDLLDYAEAIDLLRQMAKASAGSPHMQHNHPQLVRDVTAFLAVLDIRILRAQRERALERDAAARLMAKKKRADSTRRT